jgi:HSP20 family protein
MRGGRQASPGISWFGSRDRDYDSGSSGLSSKPWLSRSSDDESMPLTERIKSRLPGVGSKSSSWFGGRGRDYDSDEESWTTKMRSYLPGGGHRGRDRDEESLTTKMRSYMPGRGDYDYDEQDTWKHKMLHYLPGHHHEDYTSSMMPGGGKRSWFGGRGDRESDEESWTSKMRSYLPGRGGRGSEEEEESLPLSSRIGSYLGSSSASLANMMSRGPAVDILEYSDRYLIELELPGVKSSDVSIDVNKNNLIVSGKRLTTLTETDDSSFLREERQHGPFRRVITLNENVDASKAKADMKNGILEIDIPKVVSSTAKRISVKG